MMEIYFYFAYYVGKHLTYVKYLAFFINCLLSNFWSLHKIFYVIFFCVDQAEELVDTFFEVEVEMEKEVCRDLVCTSPKDEEGLSIFFWSYFSIADWIKILSSYKYD